MDCSFVVCLKSNIRTGLGRLLTLAALERGDKVIATARAKSLGALDDLKAKGADTLELDVTASIDTLKEVAKKAVEIHGRIDVLVNNAGKSDRIRHDPTRSNADVRVYSCRRSRGEYVCIRSFYLI
jgi:NAD(P)-dependent dehydrogenase (short-subunit alcohol dehydrogenase family)